MHHPYIGAFPVEWIDDEERIGFGLDASNNFLAGPFPSHLGIPQVRDVFMRALRMGLGDACHLNVSHCANFLSLRVEFSVHVI
jgi:hypothetical protein